MIRDLLDVYQQNAAEDQLVLDSYQLKEGLYFKLFGFGKEPEVLHIEKNLHYSGALWEFFKFADFYSQLVDMNKPVDPKKQIHSNNLYSVTFKAGTLMEGTDAESKFRESIARYFEALRVLKKDDVKILKSYKFPPVNESMLLKNRDYIVGLICYLKDKILEYKIKNNLYVKLYFNADGSEYVQESKRYLIPKIFNKNDYNLTINEVLYGLSNNNMGMNAKKPFLEHKTTNFKVPFRVTVEEALTTKKFFTWLNNQKDADGKFVTAGYLPISSAKNFALRKKELQAENAHFLHIEQGKQPIIDEYDFVPGISDKLDPPVPLRNYLLLDEFDAKNIWKKSELETLVDNWFFNGNLIKNYFNKSPKPNSVFSTFQVNLLIRYRDALRNFFQKGDNTGILNCLDALSKDMLKDMLLRSTYRKLEDTNIARGLNLRLSLFKYFNIKEKENMGDQVRKLSEDLKDKLIKEKTDPDAFGNIYCENDDAFYYYAGQLVRYQLSKSQAQDLKYYIINTILDAKNLDKFKQEIRNLQKKYSHAIGFSNIRYNKLLTAVMGYRCESFNKAGFDMFLAGVASKNMIYYTEKKEK